MKMSKFSQEIEVSGHLIDSSILTKIFDKIINIIKLPGDPITKLSFGHENPDINKTKNAIINNIQYTNFLIIFSKLSFCFFF